MKTCEAGISVIMPAYRAAELLPRVLAPLLDMRDKGLVREVIVIDDASPDDTAAVATALGATVLHMPENGGPAAARNCAAEHATGDILWFVDSDVIADPAGPEVILAAFKDPTIDAVFGRYDSEPDGDAWFSRYKNLTHRFYHGSVPRDATTFWAGCGAVRASWFHKVGGFDAQAYRRPSIEDIELGTRIHAAGGRIQVLPALEGKHLKIWSIRQSLVTDVFHRALPWSRLILRRSGLSAGLNVAPMERIRAGMAVLFLALLLACLVNLSLWPWALGLFLAIAVSNRPLFAFLRSNGGTGFALKSVAYHQIYYLYSLSVFAFCWAEHKWTLLREPAG